MTLLPSLSSPRALPSCIDTVYDVAGWATLEAEADRVRGEGIGRQTEGGVDVTFLRPPHKNRPAANHAKTEEDRQQVQSAPPCSAHNVFLFPLLPVFQPSPPLTTCHSLVQTGPSTSLGNVFIGAFFAEPSIVVLSFFIRDWRYGGPIIGCVVG